MLFMRSKKGSRLNMKCFACQAEMKPVVYNSTKFHKSEILECPDCKSKADVYYHPSTELVRKVMWEEGTK